jgi:hypothetical protein
MLSHLAGQTRPELAYAVSQLQRFCAFPRRMHWQALQGALRYLAGTTKYGLRYSLDGDDVIVGYSDSDWATDIDDRKSNGGYVFTYLGVAFSWKSKKQPGVSRSTAEAELVALDQAVREARWLRKLMAGLEMRGYQDPIPIHEDNDSCLNISNGARWSHETKHVDTKYFAVRDDIIEKRVSVLPISTSANLADIFTKPLAKTKFREFRELMGVVMIN